MPLCSEQDPRILTGRHCAPGHRGEESFQGGEEARVTGDDPRGEPGSTCLPGWLPDGASQQTSRAIWGQQDDPEDSCCPVTLESSRFPTSNPNFSLPLAHKNRHSIPRTQRLEYPLLPSTLALLKTLLVKLLAKVGTASDPSLRREPAHQLLPAAMPLTAWVSAQFWGPEGVQTICQAWESRVPCP